MTTENIQLHLVSAPNASILGPSIQLGALSAYVKRSGVAQVKTYSAFYDVWVEHFGANGYALHAQAETQQDLLFYQAYHQDPRGQALALALERWTDTTLIPELSKCARPVLAFSLVFSQLYASLCIYRRVLERLPNKLEAVVFGGSSLEWPEVQGVLAKEVQNCFWVFKEGERRLCDLLALLRSRSLLSEKHMPQGVWHVSGGVVKGKGQAPVSALNISQLPRPDFDEFFESFNKHMRRQPELRLLRERLGLKVPLEGSRGCKFACRFCASRWLWQMPQAHRSVLELKKQVLYFYKRYGVREFSFMDLNTNDWSLDFLRAMKGYEKLSFFFQVRVGLPEEFWQRLGTFSQGSVQMGLESMSATLLKKMNKRSTVLQNLQALKWAHRYQLKHLSNILTYYPGASGKEARETYELCRAVSHWGKISRSKFCLYLGNAYYRDLSPLARSKLRLKNAKNPGGAAGVYELPQNLRPKPAAAKLWKKLDRWDRARCRKPDPVLRVLSQGARGGEVLDTRFGRRVIRLDALDLELLGRTQIAQSLAELDQARVKKLARLALLYVEGGRALSLLDL